MIVLQEVIPAEWHTTQNNHLHHLSQSIILLQFTWSTQVTHSTPFHHPWSFHLSLINIQSKASKLSTLNFPWPEFRSWTKISWPKDKVLLNFNSVFFWKKKKKSNVQHWLNSGLGAQAEAGHSALYQVPSPTLGFVPLEEETYNSLKQIHLRFTLNSGWRDSISFVFPSLSYHGIVYLTGISDSLTRTPHQWSEYQTGRW